jgi:hypothetical protein
LRPLFLAALAALPLVAATSIEVHFSLLERVLAKQVFTQEGRKYVRGSKSTPCNFAYLESPKITAQNGRLSIRTRYSGRRALDLFGSCVGLGGSFLADITATPYHRQGKLALKDVHVASVEGVDSFYIRRVRQQLAASIERDFSVDLLPAAQSLLEQPPGAGYQIGVAALEVEKIEVNGDAVLVTLDLRLAVR